MNKLSYLDVFNIDHTREHDEDIRVGDLVRTGPNAFPHFTVIAVAGDTAWVRDVQNGADGLTALARCHKINGAPVLHA
ncbi:MAG TPA: hypothetical protein VGB49_01470 [Caulobacteraceae bacterium]|jgi:ABC-type tungstate transport system permease subunit